MQELMVCLRTDTLFGYGAKYRLTSHAGKLVKSIPYWLQDRKIPLILNTTNYYTSLLSLIRSKLLARASHGQVLCQTCLTLDNYTVPILLQSFNLPLTENSYQDSTTKHSPPLNILRLRM